MSWAIGDLGYRGWITIWLSREPNGTVVWDHAYRIKLTDYYCKNTGGRRCTKTYRD